MFMVYNNIKISLSTINTINISYLDEIIHTHDRILTLNFGRVKIFGGEKNIGMAMRHVRTDRICFASSSQYYTLPCPYMLE